MLLLCYLLPSMRSAPWSAGREAGQEIPIHIVPQPGLPQSCRSIGSSRSISAYVEDVPPAPLPVATRFGNQQVHRTVHTGMDMLDCGIKDPPNTKQHSSGGVRPLGAVHSHRLCVPDRA